MKVGDKVSYRYVEPRFHNTCWVSGHVKATSTTQVAVKVADRIYWLDRKDLVIMPGCDCSADKPTDCVCGD